MYYRYEGNKDVCNVINNANHNLLACIHITCSIPRIVSSTLDVRSLEPLVNLSYLYRSPRKQKKSKHDKGNKAIETPKVSHLIFSTKHTVISWYYSFMFLPGNKSLAFFKRTYTHKGIVPNIWRKCMRYICMYVV